MLRVVPTGLPNPKRSFCLLWTLRVPCHSRPLVTRQPPLHKNFLMDAQIENNQGWDPEQKDQIFHRATPGLRLAGELTFSLVLSKTLLEGRASHSIVIWTTASKLLSCVNACTVWDWVARIPRFRTAHAGHHPTGLPPRAEMFDCLPKSALLRLSAASR